MNFLAHLYLSGNDEELLLGNYLGDFVRAKDLPLYSAQVQSGIYLHRAIDIFTDTHMVVKKSTSRLWPVYSHYSKVINDIFYDHFLAAQWLKYHPLSLQEYSIKVYSILQNNMKYLPERAQLSTKHMQAHNWLFNYSSIQGVAQSLSGMSYRASAGSNMENAHMHLQDDYLLYQQEFELFFPQLQDFVANWLAEKKI